MPDSRTPRILLSSVYRPFAVDSDDSRRINPMELFHNQVTRCQGPFSFRIHHPSAGIRMIAHNIKAHSTVLDFPTFEEFKCELKEHRYDYVGISSIIMNFTKTKRMVEAVRALSPGSQIVVGGHITALDGIEDLIPADHFVQGDGISWFRKHLGQDTTTTVTQPEILASQNMEVMGLKLTPATAWIITGLGCPNRCDFCATSHFFKSYIPLMKSGRDVFDVCLKAEQVLGTHDFFIMDENFLLLKDRVEDLYSLMRRHDKAWTFHIFASAETFKNYDVGFLVELGIVKIWIGLESKFRPYPKHKGTDLKQLLQELKRNGISVLGSTILGVPEHTYEAALEEIEYSTGLGTDMQQFMLYTPLPCTTLWMQKKKDGTLLEKVPFEDIHGQYRLNWRHPHLTAEQSEELLLHAFNEDYRIGGPSLYREIETRFLGAKRHANHVSPLVRRRVDEVKASLKKATPLLWAMEQYLRFSNPVINEKARTLRREIETYLHCRSYSISITGTLALSSTIKELVKREILRIPKEPRTYRAIVERDFP